jgi:tetratricopeptide (TPR) repeat protein
MNINSQNKQKETQTETEVGNQTVQLNQAINQFLGKFPPNDQTFLEQTCNLNEANFIQQTFKDYLLRTVSFDGASELLKIMRKDKLTRRNFISWVRQSAEFHSLCQFLASASQEQIYWRIIDFWAEEGNLNQALISFHQAILLKPELVLAYCRWEENIALENKLYEKDILITRFLKDLFFRFESPQLYLSFGRLLLANGKVTQAIQSYKLSLELGTDSSGIDESYLYLWYLLGIDNNLDEAKVYYEKSQSIQVESIQKLHSYMWNILIIKKQLNKVILTGKEYSNPTLSFADFIFQVDSIVNLLYQLERLLVVCKRNLIEVQKVNSDQPYDAETCIIDALSNLDYVVSYFKYLSNSDIGFISQVATAYLGAFFQKEGKSYLALACLQNPQPVTTLKGLYYSAKNWVAQDNTYQSDYITIHPIHQFNIISQPKTIHDNVDPRVITYSRFESPATFVLILPGGGFCEIPWGTELANGIITPDRQLLIDISASPGSAVPDLSKVKLLPFQQAIHGTVAVLSIRGNDNYYHTMFELLPRFGLLELSGIRLREIDYFLIDSYALPYIKESMEILGIPHDKILEVHKFPHLKADCLIVPSWVAYPTLPTQFTTDFLRSKFLSTSNDTKNDKPRRLYLSRREQKFRRIINEDEILEFLNELGFISIMPESMPITEIASLMASAEVVIGYGSGNANLVFCSHGTKVIEIFSPYFIGDTYRILSYLCGLEYYYFIAEKTIESNHWRQIIYGDISKVDILVNIDLFKKMMSFAGLV